MSGSIQGGQYQDGRMMRQVDEREEEMGMDEYGVSKNDRLLSGLLIYGPLYTFNH